MSKGISLTIITICGLLLTATARADDQQSSDNSSSQNQDRRTSISESDSSQGSSTSRHHLSGRIEELRQVTVRNDQGESESHEMARLRLRDGETAQVDLGPSSIVSDLNLQRGDRIRVAAHPSTVNGQEVLAADRVAVDSSSGRNWAAQGANQTGTRTIRGEIEGFRQVYLRDTQGQRVQHALAKLRLQSGRSVVVDLGPKRDLDDLNLEVGQSIRVRGQRGTVDGRPAFLANQIRVGNETRQIARNQAQQRGEEFTLRGTVAGYQVATVESGNKQLVLLNLRLKDGRSVLIDTTHYVPGEFDLKDLDVNDQVAIQGHETRVQGKRVLVADNVQFFSPSERQGAVGRPGQGQRSFGSGQSSSNQWNNQSPNDQQSDQSNEDQFDSEQF